MRIVVGIALALLWGLRIAAAQPFPEVPVGDPRSTGAGSTKIPVTLSGGTEVMEAEAAATSAAAAPIALEQPIDPNTYICGSGDVFELNFWGQQNFRLRIAADLEGRAFISKVGFVDVAKKTLAAVRTEVNKKVRSNYPGLQFALTLVAPRSFIVHVAENVAHPGAITTSPLERVSSVLARAGGATGSRRRISIRRQSGETITADLVMYELTGNTTYNPFVLDGDVVTVPFTGVTATIAGAVRRPGTYELIKSKDLAELLELAGGYSSSVVRTLPIRLIRKNQAQQASFIDLAFAGDAVPNTSLQDQDQLLVRSTDELQRTIQLIGAVAGANALDQATSTVRLAYVEGDTVLSLIDRAGGIKAAGDLSRSYISRPRLRSAPELITVDLEALLVRRDFRADRPVKMGDLIVVPPMQYSVRVEGAVARAGLYPYNPTFGVAEYVATAGGRTRSGKDLDNAQLIGANGKTRGNGKGVKPSPGDAILVPERMFTTPEIVQLALAVGGLVLSGVAITLAATR